MATVQVAANADMHAASTWYGIVTAATPNEIVITLGAFEAIYSGSFTYDAVGNVYGTLMGYEETYNGTPLVSISGLNVSATYAQQLIQSNQLQVLFQTALSGDDTFTLTPGTHVIDGYGGYNTVTEAMPHTAYTVAFSESAFTVQSLTTQDALYNVQRVDFSDGVARLDATGNAEEAARLYKAALNRLPDAGGLDYWTALLDNHTMGLDDVALGFINSPEFNSHYGNLDNLSFVQQLYQNVLGRTGEAGGVQYWTGQLASGMNRAQVLVGFSDSMENKNNTSTYIGDKDRGEAYRLYQSALNRPPDANGLTYWTTSLDQGMTSRQAAQGFVDSPEFTQLFAGLDTKGFVDEMYQNTLHRAADPGGEQYWIGQVNQGMSKAQVLLGFSDSLENRLNTAGATHDGWVYLG